MFAGADHVDHVNTQIPYAVLCGTVATGLFLASGYGVGPLALLPVGIVGLVVAAYYLSQHTDVRMPTVFGSSSD
jgi:Na+/H+ antiporter NhaC